MPSLTLRAATDADLPGILAIYNDAVRHTTAIWNETTVDLANRQAWFKARMERGFPVLVAERDGVLAGYASYGDWRPFEGFRHTVEHSIYLHAEFRGQGIGQKLLAALVNAASRNGVHVMVAAIDARNLASIRLHEKLGFTHAGLFRQVGVKFGRWLDLACLERRLDDADEPPRQAG